jgi:hypothetical protein
MLSDPLTQNAEQATSMRACGFRGRKTCSIGAVAAMLGMPIRIIGDLVKSFASAGSPSVPVLITQIRRHPTSIVRHACGRLTISGKILGLHAGWEQMDITLGGENLGAFVKALLDGRINPGVLTKRVKESMQDVFRTNWVEIFDA